MGFGIMVNLKDLLKDGEKITLDSIFNASTVQYRGKTYPLRFTIAAELWLEKYGIHLGTLAQLMTKEPTTTILRLVYAALPAEDFREKITFEAFCRTLPEADGKEIVKRVDWILACFFRQIVSAYKTPTEEGVVQNEKTVVKKN